MSGGTRRGVRHPFVSPVMPSAKKARLEEDEVTRRQASRAASSSSNKELLAERRHLLEKIKEKEIKLQQLKNADEMEKVSKSNDEFISLLVLVGRTEQAHRKMERS